MTTSPPSYADPSKLGQRLSLSKETTKQKIARLTSLIEVLTQQRDAALINMNDLANMERYVFRFNRLSASIADSLRHLDRAARLVRRLIDLPAVADEDLLRKGKA